MVATYTGNKTEKSEWFYYIGLLKPTDEAEILYIKKQQKILLNCINSLETSPQSKKTLLNIKTHIQVLHKF